MENILLIALAFGLGGLLKGATGAGAPLLAVPLLSLLYDVPFAIAVFLIPNLIPNFWQVWKFRQHLLPGRFVVRLAVSGGIGAGLGTVLLAGLPGDALMIGVAIAVFAYVGFRIARPGWRLSLELATRIVWPVGTLAGVLQGATGISAPISLSFLNSMKLERQEFIPTVSLYFLATGIVQAPALFAFNIMTWERLAYGLLALIPLFAFMPLGNWLGQRVPKAIFDRVILAILTLLAVRLLVSPFL